jgi:hypothetical protein
MPLWGWIVIGLLAVAPVILLAPIVAPMALVILVTAIVGVSKGSRTWLRLKSRRMALGVAAGAAALLLLTGGVSAAMIPRSSDLVASNVATTGIESAPKSALGPTVSATSSSTPTPTPTPTQVTSSTEEVVTKPVAFKKTTVKDASSPRGRTALAVAGKNGVRTLTYRVTLVNGVEIKRQLISDVVSTQPVTQVTKVGTLDPKPKPKPKRAAPKCDPNYAGACVPIASDVDCAGGSGNGPAYFDGVARVVGQDIYGLDRDGDGYACEK